MWIRGIAAGVFSALVAMVGVAGAQAATITEFPGISNPEAITAGPGGALFFTQNGPPRIARISTSGQVSSFAAGISTDATLAGITQGPDGNIWFVENDPARIGRLNPTTGAVLEIEPDDDFFTSDSGPEDIVSGPDGALWFTENTNDAIGRIDPRTLEIEEFDTGDDPNGGPNSITVGSDGNLWFTQEDNPGAIGRMTPLGAVTEFPVPTPNSVPEDITAGPDGNLWFTESGLAGGRIGRITVNGAVTEFSAGVTPFSRPDGIAAGADGNLWFTERGNPGRIGRITPTGTVTEFTAGLTPGSEPHRISGGPDGNLWFTERLGDRIGRVNIQVPPTAATGGLEATGAGTATVGGTVNPSGLPTTYSFEYGTSTQYGQRTAVSGAGNGEADQPVSAALTGLASGTTYHYRITASNSAGTAVGDDRTFTSSADAPMAPPPPPPPPTPPPGLSVTAAAPGPVSSTSITLNALASGGRAALTTVGECRSSSGRIRRSVPRVTLAPTSRLKLRIDGLKPFTRYRCRVSASDATGSARGPDQLIRTRDSRLSLRFANRFTGQEGRRVNLRYRISVPGRVQLRITRARTARGGASRSRVVRGKAKAGSNALALPPLSAGRYRLTLLAVGRDGQRRSEGASLRVPTSVRDPLYTG